jgi:glucokinase
MADVTLAVDVGGTKIAVGLVDSAGSLIHTATLPTPHGDAEAVWAVAERLITDTTAAVGVRGVGIASAGPIHLPNGTVSPINIGAWRDFPIVDRVAALVPGVPVRLGGDGLCMALGEHRHGAGRGTQFLLGMVVSTGVGGGLVFNGAPYYGASGNAGHVGHVVVDLDGEPCTCGGHGCVETIASGPRMVRWARSHGWAGAGGAKELAKAASAGNGVALSAFRRSGTALAAMIASVAAVCDLDLAVIGGGVARAGPLLFDPLREALGGGHVGYAGLDFLRGLRVVPAQLGGDAGLVGAAALVGERRV